MRSPWTTYLLIASSAATTVHTTNGLITGHPAPQSPQVLEFLGIPYAKPPLGDLRFAPPQRFTSSRSLDASTFGNDCPLPVSPPVQYPGFTPQAQRILDYFASGSGTPQSEDCLTLNIWAKPTAAKKPVVVFFYGGRMYIFFFFFLVNIERLVLMEVGFTLGNTNTPFYNGKYFAAAQDVIVITVNYRLNIFGFPGAPSGPQNLGLRDQRLAVEWIRDNIHAFGGDSRKITIAGQSSGGVAVDYWTYAFEHDPIVNGIIATSGNAFSFPVNKKNVTTANWKTVVEAVGCGNDTDAMSCMRRADWKDIKKASEGVKPTPSTSVLRSVPAFYPTPDEEYVFEEYVSRTRQGKFAKIPLFEGNNHNEAGYYRIPAYGRGVVPTDEQVASFHLQSFTCPVTYQAQKRRDHGVRTWTWRYFGDWNNTRLYPGSGAYHGSDLHMIFGASEDVSGLETAEEQRRLTRVMQRAWFEFSNDPNRGLRKMGWPEYDAGEKTLVLLGKGDGSKVEFVKPSEFDAPCSTVTLGALAT